MIRGTLTTDERVSLITIVLSDEDECERVRNISGDDAQAFIDMIDEVSAPFRLQKVGFHSNFHTPSVRYWIGSHNQSAESMCGLYTVFVADKP